MMLVMASCQKSITSTTQDPDSLRLAGTQIELEHRVAVAQLKVARLERNQQDLSPIHQLAMLKSRRRELSSHKSELEMQISSIEEQSLLAKGSQIEAARNAMTGQELPSLLTESGRSYEQVRIVAITDSGIQIRHSTGSARLGYHDLNASQHERFGLDEGLAITAAATEARQLAAYNQQIDAQPADLPATAETPAAPHADRLRAQASSREPVLSAFDRRVELGSSASVSRRTAARYRSSYRSSGCYYDYSPTYQPSPSTYGSPVSAKAMAVIWPSGAPVYPNTPSTPSPPNTPAAAVVFPLSTPRSSANPVP
jgi:hypothetical protein